MNDHDDGTTHTAAGHYNGFVAYRSAARSQKKKNSRRAFRTMLSSRPTSSRLRKVRRPRACHYCRNPARSIKARPSVLDGGRAVGSRGVEPPSERPRRGASLYIIERPSSARPRFPGARARRAGRRTHARHRAAPLRLAFLTASRLAPASRGGGRPNTKNQKKALAPPRGRVRLTRGAGEDADDLCGHLRRTARPTTTSSRGDQKI